MKKPLPMFESGAVVPVQRLHYPDFRAAHESSEREFNAEISCPKPVFPKIDKQLTLQAFSRPVDEQRVTESAIRRKGTRTMIDRGEIPEDCDLHGLFDEDLTIVSSPIGNAPQRQLDLSDLRMSDRNRKYPSSLATQPSPYKLLDGEAMAEENEKIQQLSHHIHDHYFPPEEHAESQDANAEIDISQSQYSSDWVRFYADEFDTTKIQQQIERSDQNQFRLLYGVVQDLNIPISEGKIIQNVQWKATLQKFDFMREHVLAVLERLQAHLDRLDERVSGAVNAEQLERSSYELFFKECTISELPLDDLFSRKEVDERQLGPKTSQKTSFQEDAETSASGEPQSAQEQQIEKLPAEDLQRRALEKME